MSTNNQISANEWLSTTQLKNVFENVWLEKLNNYINEWIIWNRIILSFNGNSNNGNDYDSMVHNQLSDYHLVCLRSIVDCGCKWWNRRRLDSEGVCSFELNDRNVVLVAVIIVDLMCDSQMGLEISWTGERLVTRRTLDWNDTNKSVKRMQQWSEVIRDKPYIFCLVSSRWCSSQRPQSPRLCPGFQW